jgi:hypothetical protein
MRRLSGKDIVSPQEQAIRIRLLLGTGASQTALWLDCAIL